jgi:N-acetylglucosamine malate deacetylase 1
LPQSDAKPTTMLAFGAHPDDIEFGCGAVIAKATCAGQFAHFVVCSRGEAGTFGTPAERVEEAQNAAKLLRATIEFVELDGDAHLELSAAHAIKLAAILRRFKPQIVLAPSLVENQHPDHARLARLVRDATRLARYGGLRELKEQPVHVARHLFYYAVSPDAEPSDISPIYVDISAPEIIADWTAAMEAHRSQTSARKYVELQITRARLNGLRTGVGHAVALFPNEPLLVDSLSVFSGEANRF